MQLILDHEPKIRFQISHEQPILLVGSCFAEEIGNQLKQDLFEVTVNPHGILFNPHSIAQSLLCAMQRQYDPLIYEDACNAYALQWHGRFKQPTIKQLNEQLIESNTLAKRAFDRANVIFITWGSAWVYTHQSTNAIVGNCHKLPNHFFNKRLLSVEEIVHVWTNILNLFQAFNKTVVFTISPVRYVKDGLYENNVSKSTLFLAFNKLQQQFPFIHYMPSYECIVDVLRDYRFYKEDLVHPNAMAIKYVYEKVVSLAFDNATLQNLPAIRLLVGMMQHRVLTNEPEKLAQYHSKLAEKKQALIAQLPYLINRLPA
jgi:hypothetical protein